MRKIIALSFIISINNISAQVNDFKNIDFTRADNIAKLNEGEDLQNLSLLSYKLTSKLQTDVEKFRAIYTWVSKNISGDYKLQNRITRKREKYKNDSLNIIKWNDKFKKIAFKKLLKQQKTICTGYAYLIKELAFLADIECEIIDGFARTVDLNVHNLEMANHSWNTVKLNGKWYLCDATWSSGYFNENKIFRKDYNDGYFLSYPILFAKNHYPIYEKWLLTDSTTSTTFINSPLVYGKTFIHKVMPLSPSKMNIEVKKNEDVHFKFKALKDVTLDKVYLIRFLEDSEKKYDIFDLKKENNIIDFKTKFKTKGSYDVHLKIDNDIVATYIIKVNSK